EDGNPARANIKQALGRNPDGCNCWLKGRQFTSPYPLLKLIIDEQQKDLQRSFRDSDVCCYDLRKSEYAGPNVTISQDGNVPQQG
nr:hypothetical protein [Tanacetum cinerariifolium]